jgi:Zn-dependent M28 family amino/carboxypeptidase
MNLFDYVRNIEGLRDGFYQYDALMERASFIENEFSAYGYAVEKDELTFHDRTYWNIIASQPSSHKQGEQILIGAHYDAVMGSPGADDNASGVAVMLETAKALRNISNLQFIAFTLEEPQPHCLNFLIGSKHFVKKAKDNNVRYKAVFILESVGYVSDRPGSQIIPPFIKAPSVGNFIGLVGNRKSQRHMKLFADVATRSVPDLKVVTYIPPMRGFIMPETRFSDHAPFWDHGYPAVMITDTAMFRNPNYHTAADTSETLSPDFMMHVAEALIQTIREVV